MNTDQASIRRFAGVACDDGILYPYVEVTGIVAAERIVDLSRVESSKGNFYHAITDVKKHYIWGPQNAQWEFVEMIP